MVFGVGRVAQCHEHTAAQLLKVLAGKVHAMASLPITATNPSVLANILDTMEVVLRRWSGLLSLQRLQPTIAALEASTALRSVLIGRPLLAHAIWHLLAIIDHGGTLRAAGEEIAS